jgi:ubiquinol-cytochrome c reductase iron-sulfur subunit
MSDTTHGDTGHGHEVEPITYTQSDERGRILLGLDEHRSRRTDTSQRAAKRAERQIAGMFTFAAICFVAAIAAYLLVPKHDIVWVPVLGNVSASNLSLGGLIGLGTLLIGVGAIQWARALMPDEEVIQERHELRGSDEAREDTIEQFRRGAQESGFMSRPIIRRSLLGAMALFPLPIAFLLGDLGTAPDDKLRHTAWGNKPRTRILNQGSGQMVRPEDLAVGGLINAIPVGLTELEEQEGSQNARAKAAIILVRMNPDEIKSTQGPNWDYEGIVAYSKICTHVGCPISLYQQRTHSLLCPCHQSTFDLSDSGRAVFGPAARHMPQLQLDVDSEGYLVAVGDFAEPVGPSFWERG